jgi:hypothetical protein
MPVPSELVRDAEAIVFARAQGLSSVPGEEGGLIGAKTKVRFAVLRVLKGELPAGELAFNGVLTARDDPNEKPVPYDFVRPGGRSGNCFALGYRQGADYLLLLRGSGQAADAQPRQLTPYWSALAPTNEQIFGGENDAWFLWVARQLTVGRAGRVESHRSRQSPSGF